MQKWMSKICEKGRIFFWKKGTFFYTDRMSNFKTHKLSEPKKIDTSSLTPKPKKKLVRKIVSIFFLIASFLFLV